MKGFVLLGLLANAYHCPHEPEYMPDGHPHSVDMTVDLAFVQDFSTNSHKVWSDDQVQWLMAYTVQEVDKIFNVDLDGNAVSDRVKFSFHRANDKSIVRGAGCGLGNECLCNDALPNSAADESSRYKFTLEQLHCQDGGNSCQAIDDFYSRVWVDLPHRTDVLDAPLEIAQPYLDVPMDDLETGQRSVRVTAIVTGDCARESGRSTTDAELQDWYWTGIEEWIQNEYLSWPGLDKDGTVDEGSVCNVRDYPTMNEFMRAMKRSNTGLTVLTNDGFCNANGGILSHPDVIPSGGASDHTLNSYYAAGRYMSGVAARHDVTYQSVFWRGEKYMDVAEIAASFVDAIVNVVEQLACTSPAATKTMT